MPGRPNPTIRRKSHPMPNETRIVDALSEIEDGMRRLVSAETGRYEIAWEIWSKAMSSTIELPHVMHPLWLIWGALTDWVENHPEETSRAESTMVRAATEWLSLPNSDTVARKIYLDRWVFDEMGYQRSIFL